MQFYMWFKLIAWIAWVSIRRNDPVHYGRLCQDGHVRMESPYACTRYILKWVFSP